MDNKYVNRAKISEAKFRELVRLFALDLTATQIAKLSGLNRNTVNRYVKEIRKRLAEYCEITAPLMNHNGCEYCKLDGEIRYVGICEKNGTVCVRKAGNEEASMGTSTKVISERPRADLIIDLESDRRIWPKGRKQLRESSRSKLNRIDGFMGYIKSRLEKFKGLHSQTYFLHLKESEFRYNNNKDELYHLILKIVRNKPLF